MHVNADRTVSLQGSGEVDVSCESLSTTKGPVPGQPFPYSDHEALTAEFLFTPAKKGNGRPEREFGCISGICGPEILIIFIFP